MNLGVVTEGYSGSGQVSQQLDRIDEQVTALFDLDKRLEICLQPVLSVNPSEADKKACDEEVADPLVPLANRLAGVVGSLLALHDSLDRYVSDCEL